MSLSMFIILYKGISMSHIKILVSSVSIYWKKFVFRDRNVTQNDSNSDESTNTPEVALTQNRFTPSTTVSPVNVKMHPLVNNTSREGTGISNTETDIGSKELILTDLEDQSNSLKTSHGNIRSVVLDLGESITNHLQQITKRMDEQQKANNDRENNFDSKLLCMTQELRQMSRRLDDLQKTNEDGKMDLKDFEAKLNCIDKILEQVDKKRIQAKNNHHELRRRFDCFEHRVNKTYLS